MPTILPVLTTELISERCPLDALIDVRATPQPVRSDRTRRDKLNVLFGVASWGLGHSTRDLPLIYRLLERGHSVTVVSSDRALQLLRQELGGRCDYLDWPDIPLTLSKSVPLFYAKFTLSMPLAFRAIVAENRSLDHLLSRRHFDRIVSDSRFGIRSRSVPSFQLAHGLRFIAPKRNVAVEIAMEYVYHRCFGRTAQFVVPDFAFGGLSGELSHNLRFVRPEKVSYIGILSSVERNSANHDIDCYISVSGREPQRKVFEDIILRQVGAIPGRVVVSLGKPEEAGQVWQQGNATIHAYVNRRQQQELMNRAEVIVSRSGYTTMMELAELGKRALLIPTPGQTEQEYLAAYHHRVGTFYSVHQSKLSLESDLEIARAYPGFQPPHRTQTSIERFIDLIAS